MTPPEQTTTNQQEIKNKKKKSQFREYAEALLTAVLIAFFLRAFVVEAFKIPSGSMIPTLVVGDHIFVNKFVYGIRVPLTKKWLVRFKTPERGETIVFIYPENPKLDFIKRVVGLPGDKIRIDGDDLYVNGEKVRVEPIEVAGVDPENSNRLTLQSDANFPDGSKFREIPRYPNWEEYQVFLERLGEHTHLKQEGSFDFLRNREITVPDDKLFVMGDNRDNSRDSREWGFVPMENVKGRAMFIWLSLRHNEQGSIVGVRWDRFGQGIP